VPNFVPGFSVIPLSDYTLPTFVKPLEASAVPVNKPGRRPVGSPLAVEVSLVRSTSDLKRSAIEGLDLSQARVLVRSPRFE